VEVSALTYSGGVGLHGRSPLLRLQSDERLVALVRRGNDAAFETLVSRYHSRLLAFCRHMLGSREDAEDILQDVMAAAYNAILADERPINVRPWLYRIARNRSLNHLRRVQPVGMDSMDIHLHAHGLTTADKVHDREEFRLLVVDIQRLPESQRTALVLREMDALSYDQIAEAMETTIPSVKSLLVRARIGLAEASEARRLSCDEVRIELGEVAEGIQRKPSPLVRRHIKTCTRCATFQGHLKETSRSLALLLPVGPLVLLRKLALAHLGHSAGSTAGAAAGSSAAATSGAAASGAAASGAAASGAAASGVAATSGASAALAGAGAAVGATGGASSLVSAGVGALAAKAAASLAAAALVTAGAVEVDHAVQHPPAITPPPPAVAATGGAALGPPHHLATLTKVSAPATKPRAKTASAPATRTTSTVTATTSTTSTTAATSTPAATTTSPTTATTTTTSVTTVLPSTGSSPGDSSDPGTSTSESAGTTTTSGGASPTPTTTTPTTATTSTPTSTTPTVSAPTQGGGSSGGQ
jgi:RNA polymerase sigma factor (sigma-70 family)